jgi:hypothetical protein
MNKAYFLAAILLLAANVVFAQGSDILSRCPTLSRLVDSGQAEQLKDPVFTDRNAARQFAKTCSKVVSELDSIGLLPADAAELRRLAALEAEFLTGDTYSLSTSDIKSVVTLRKLVKIPPPDGLVYVKRYSSMSAMPPDVAEVFRRLAPGENARVRGVTIQGRYIALLDAEYKEELADNLAHEMVHAYITLVSPTDLPRWFQEGAAIYFSAGTETRFYSKVGDPKMTQVTIPEDYKRKLYSFQHIEKKIGREKLYEFVRKSVLTGNVDTRAALGLGPMRKVPDPPVWPAFAIAGGIAGVFLAAWLISRRRNRWQYY